MKLFSVFRIGILLDIVSDVADCLDLLNSLIGDRKIEFVLDSSDKINNVQRISTEIVLNISFSSNLVSFYSELFCNNILELF